MNRIVNNYGAANQTDANSIRTNFLQDSIESDVRDFIKWHSLTPTEIIALEHLLLLSVTAICSENILMKAINMRKQEREQKA